MAIAEVWTFPLRLHTPGFIGGAAPNERAELRATAFRGALRAWYRLLVGPEVAAGLLPSGGPGLPRGALRESRLFGGTGAGEGQGKVTLQVRGDALVGDQGWSNKELRQSEPGLAYLGFSLDMGANRKKALRAGTEFELRMVWPRGAPPELAAPLLDALWLLVHFGGVGTRANRGFGALGFAGPPRFSDLIGRALPEARALPGAAALPGNADAAKALQDGLTALWGRRLAAVPARVVDSPAVPPAAGPAQHLDFDGPVDARRSRAALWLGPLGAGWSSARAAQDAFGRAFAEHRKEMGVDHLPSGALRTLSRGERLAHAPWRAAYGLPLALRPVGMGGGPGFELLPVLPAGAPARPPGGGTPEPRRELEEGGRAPSPLRVSVVQAGRTYGVSLMLLSGPWPGRDLPLRERRQGRGHIPVDTTNNLPRQLLKSLPDCLNLKVSP
jgi:CRISPR-associated protein Cmr1